MNKENPEQLENQIESLYAENIRIEKELYSDNCLPISTEKILRQELNRNNIELSALLEKYFEPLEGDNDFNNPDNPEYIQDAIESYEGSFTDSNNKKLLQEQVDNVIQDMLDQNI